MYNGYITGQSPFRTGLTKAGIPCPDHRLPADAKWENVQ